MFRPISDGKKRTLCRDPRRGVCSGFSANLGNPLGSEKRPSVELLDREQMLAAPGLPIVDLNPVDQLLRTSFVKHGEGQP
jgi:hypothetical protein